MAKTLMKRRMTIVTHINPDLDALGAIWLLTRFGGNEFKNAVFEFVPAGSRLTREDNNCVHVDTGLGKFDHHQTERGRINTSATKLVYEWLVKGGRIKKMSELERIVELITDNDHFKEYFWPEPEADRYIFCIDSMLNGVKMGGYLTDDDALVRFALVCLDGIFVSFKSRIKAERAIESGMSFQTKWGKALAVESANAGVLKLALKKGYRLAIRRDPDIGSIRIKAAPLEEIDLTPVYEQLRKEDKQATWYLHAGRRMILNGSNRNPEMIPSKLALDRVIKLVKNIN